VKSFLGLAFALGITLAFGAAWWLGSRDSGSFMERTINQQWLFLVALPYNFLVMQLLGESNFSSEAPGMIAIATATEAAVGYIVGATLEAAARALWRGARRIGARA